MPLFIAFAGLVVNKIRGNNWLSQSEKRFLLYDLFYGCLCVNSIILVFGLFTENYSKTYDTAISIASLCVGIFYLLILLLSSILFSKKEEYFYSFKLTMYKPWFFVASLWMKILGCFIYLFTFELFNLAAVIPLSIAFGSIIALLIIKPYPNNLRYLVNEVSIFLCYLAYVLIMEV